MEKAVTYAGTKRLIEKVLKLDWENEDVNKEQQVLIEVED
jgi:hypothetical protein